nr:T9SS C-terminal target domain-containing protein [Flavobacteriales bacterium]
MKSLIALFILYSHCIIAQNVSLQIACQLPSYLNEASGIELSPDGTFWTHNDSGNEAKIYQIDDQCNVIRTVNLLGVSNNDWEDLALSDSLI